MKTRCIWFFACLLLTLSAPALAEKKGKAYGAGGVSEEHMNESAAEHRKAWAGEKEKKEKTAKKEEKEKKEKTTKKEKTAKKEKKSK